MKDYIVGFDIGGTKCAVILGSMRQDGTAEVGDKISFATDIGRGWRAVTAELFSSTDALLARNLLTPADIESVGVSCGGPLSSRDGVIKCPPNLPDWDNVPLTAMITERFGIPAKLQNDANACALAEWRFGAGAGFDSLIFLTFGTGMGAGLILDGRLYSGADDMAGEVGHIRLAEDGPEGYGKRGSFEGFCSGGGIARLARSMALDAICAGNAPSFCPKESALDSVSAKSVAVAATDGDALALEVYRVCGEYLGRGLAILVDILNPQAIIIGSIFQRSPELLIPAMSKALEREALSISRGSCVIRPAMLGDSIGDMAALGVALL